MTRSSRGRENGAKQVLPAPSDLGDRAASVERPRRSHVDSRYSGISLRVYWKIVMSRLPLPGGRCGAVVMGYPCEQARGYPITTTPPPTDEACPCRKSLRVKLPFGHKIKIAPSAENITPTGRGRSRRAAPTVIPAIP